jgi:hypothetical protein
MLMLPMISLLPKESIQVLTKKFDPAFETLNQAEVQAVVTAELEGAMTNQQMQEICDRHPSDLTKLLQGLVKREFLASVRQGRGTRYTLPGKEGYILGLFERGVATALTPDSPQTLMAGSLQRLENSSQAV